MSHILPQENAPIRGIRDDSTYTPLHAHHTSQQVARKIWTGIGRQHQTLWQVSAPRLGRPGRNQPANAGAVGGGGGASIGQVWTRHLAPAAPASRPSLPTQFHDCACHADSALQFLSLPSALNGGKSWAASTGLWALSGGGGAATRGATGTDNTGRGHPSPMRATEPGHQRDGCPRLTTKTMSSCCTTASCGGLVYTKGRLPPPLYRYSPSATMLLRARWANTSW